MKSLVGAALFSLLLLSCSSPTGPDLQAGVLAEFDVNGERFSIFITNMQTVRQVLDLRDGRSNAKIPSGRIVKGQVQYNRPWTWHIDSEDITMAEVTIELCDGTPSYLEAHLDDWIRTVGYFCPWSAELVSVIEYR